jgi:hypothetical protein
VPACFTSFAMTCSARVRMRVYIPHFRMHPAYRAYAGWDSLRYNGFTGNVIIETDAMRKLMGLLVGFGVGAALGVVLVMLFAPASGEELVKRLQTGYRETLTEARKASDQRRAQLEAQLTARSRR